MSESNNSSNLGFLTSFIIISVLLSIITFSLALKQNQKCIS